MKKIYQKSHNDCYPCCLAMLLKMRKEDIPIFNSKNYAKEKLQWLESNNLVAITIPTTLKTKKFPMLYFPKSFFCLGFLRLKHKRFGHAVILKFDKIEIDSWKFKIWHDPLGSESPYDISNLEFIEFIISKDFLK